MSPLFTIGDWTVDYAGQIKHLKCDHPLTWSTNHRCWIRSGFDEGHYVPVAAPAMVALISKIQYDVWFTTTRNGRHEKS